MSFFTNMLQGFTSTAPIRTNSPPHTSGNVIPSQIDDEDWEIVNKANGRYSVIGQDHSPFDLVAWHGNAVPYKVCSNYSVAIMMM